MEIATPKNRSELLTCIRSSWDALLHFIAGRDLTHPDAGGWTILDNLAHITEWERFILRNQFQGLPAHEALQVTEESLRPLEIDRLNALLLKRNRQHSLENVLADFHAVHAQLMAAIEQASEADIARHTRCIDAEINPVLTWVLYNTRDHYDEHLQTMQKEGQTMKSMALRPIDIKRDFGQLAALFTSEQLETTTETGLKEDYEQHKARIFRLMAAENEQEELLGFNWATRSRFDASEAYFYVIVRPEHRRQGIGGLLYTDIEQAARAAQIQRLKVSVRDDRPECRAFAEGNGFTEKSHAMAMALDLTAFDDRPYEAIIARLKGEGFQFTTMESLGNTEEAQRKLYALNDAATRDTMGTDGSSAWLSFEDFQKSVCQANWYIPAAQNVVIEKASGDWVAMSAITRFDGADYAYNLFTGVDRRYRGRKLAQAVKVIALRYAREMLKVKTVRTHHNTKNDPMIAIDRKMGYVQAPGNFSMEKGL